MKDRSDSSGVISKIASVTIKGGAYGSLAAADNSTYAIAAQQIVSLKVGGVTVPLKIGASNDRMSTVNQSGASRPLGPSFGSTISDKFDFHALEVA